MRDYDPFRVNFVVICVAQNSGGYAYAEVVGVPLLFVVFADAILNLSRKSR